VSYRLQLDVDVCRHNNYESIDNYQSIFMGARYESKLGRVRKWLDSDALQHTGGDLTALMF